MTPTQSERVLVPLDVAIEALRDVLVDHNVSANRIIAEFELTVAVYMEDE